MTKPVEVHLRDEIGAWGITDAAFAAELKAVGPAPIVLFVNSPGGSVFAGVSIYNTLLRHPAPVVVVVDGIAASIASLIAMAGQTVIMGRSSELMIHLPSGVVMGQVQDMRKMADVLDRIAVDIASVYRDKAGGTIDHWRAAMTAETWYSAQEAVDARLADKVAPAPTADRAAAAVTASVGSATPRWADGLAAEDVQMLGPYLAWSARYVERAEKLMREQVEPPPPPVPVVDTLPNGRRRRRVGGLTVIGGAR